MKELCDLTDDELTTYYRVYKDLMTESKRADLTKRFQYDTKFAYHVVRLVNECEQIMTEHDLDLERNREQLKAVRRGEWTLEYLHEWFSEKEKSLESLYAASTLRHSPDEPAVKQLLVDCLEHHYGSLADAVKIDPNMEILVRELREVLDRHAPLVKGE